MDEYIVKICNKSIFDEGDYYFYKNGLLHREEGSAIILQFSTNKFKSLNDKDLYKEEIITNKFPQDYKFKYLEIGDSGVSLATHYLNGIHYSQEQFEKIKEKLDLKNELNNELSITKNNTQKPKI